MSILSPLSSVLGCGAPRASEKEPASPANGAACSAAKRRIPENASVHCGDGESTLPPKRPYDDTPSALACGSACCGQCAHRATAGLDHACDRPQAYDAGAVRRNG